MASTREQRSHGCCGDACCFSSTTRRMLLRSLRDGYPNLAFTLNTSTARYQAIVPGEGGEKERRMSYQRLHLSLHLGILYGAGHLESVYFFHHLGDSPAASRLLSGNLAAGCWLFVSGE